MTTENAQQLVLERFREKCRMAGGPRPGFVLRRKAVLFVQGDHPEVDLEQGIAMLVEKGVLKASDNGDFLFLTAAGVEEL
jgi:hypothetical protein